MNFVLEKKFFIRFYGLESLHSTPRKREKEKNLIWSIWMALTALENKCACPSVLIQ